MARDRYHFHCTDGFHAVLDQPGRSLPSSQLHAYAEGTARALMAECPRHDDWSAWIVDVHDAQGRRVTMLGFRDVRSERAAA